MTDDELEAIYHRVTFVEGGSPIDFARAIEALCATDYGEGFEEGFKAGAAAEREACADLCHKFVWAHGDGARLCEGAIRSRNAESDK